MTPAQHESRGKRLQQLERRTARRNRILLSAGLLAVICAVYFPALHGGFILDDDRLLTDSPLIQAQDGLLRIWFSSEPADYWPLANSTLWIEWRVWGMQPTGYHVTNLALHWMSTLLVWAILRRLSVPGAFLAALLFAVHPVNVESVAWISQRKGLLAMVFFLLSILWYLRTEEEQGANGEKESRGVGGWGMWYWLSFLAFVLSMLSKGSAAILPVVLLGLVWWEKGRTGRSDLARTAPFFLLAAILTGVNVWFQTHGADVVVRDVTLGQRITGAGAVVWFYLAKALLPLNLIFIYPQWNIQADVLWWLPTAAGCVATAVLAWQLRGSRPNWSRAMLFAWGFFCVALAPVMGFTDVGFMRYSLVADHYQYIAIVGVVAAVGAGWSAWHDRVRNAVRPATIGVAMATVGALAFLTWQQCRPYVDAVTLYRATLERNPQCRLIHNNLGTMLVRAGQLPEAIQQYRRALALDSTYTEAHDNLGVALEKAGDTQQAIEEFEAALRLNPNYAKAHFDLGHVLINAGREEDGIAQNQLALQLKPDYAEAYYNLGVAQARRGQLEQAVQSYLQAVRLKPDYVEAHQNLGNAFFNKGHVPEAIEQYRQALNLRPESAEIRNNFGAILAESGRLQEAIMQYKEALRLKPQRIDAWISLASIYAQMKRIEDATAAAQNALTMARSQGESALAQQIETWLTGYSADPLKQSEGILGSENGTATPQP